MLFLIVLTASTALVALIRRRRATWRDHARVGMALAMAVAGLSHLARPDPFLQHLPDWLPGRAGLVAVTGVAEIALAAALVWPGRSRVLPGRLLAGYLVAVFPANVYVAVQGVDVEGQPDGPYAWLRLPFQALFVAWALWSTSGDERLSRPPVARPPIPVG
jgi:uncharacterized membrane protein